MKADKLASFRLNSELWEQFQTFAKDNGTTATALLIGYIQSVVNTGNVIASTPQSIQPSIDNSPKLSISCIDKRIDDKINTAIQGINTTSIQDIDDTVKKLIADSLADGDIGDAIAKCYSNMMGQFNELLNQMEELKAAIPPVTVPSSQSPITNNQSPVTSPQSTVTNPPSQITEDQKLELIELLGIQDICNGLGEERRYWDAKLINGGIDQRILDNSALLETALSIHFTPKMSPNKRLNTILRALGYAPTKGQQKKVEGRYKETYHCFVKL